MKNIEHPYQDSVAHLAQPLNSPMRHTLPTPCPLFVQTQDLGNRNRMGTQLFDPSLEGGLTPISRDFLELLGAASKQDNPSINYLLTVSSLDNHLCNALTTQCLTSDEALAPQACDGVTN